MKIKIEPIKHFVPGKGLVAVEQVNVEVGQFRLGDGVRGNYELQNVEVQEGGRERVIGVTNGSIELTPEQFAEWKASDGLQFARFIVTNAGLNALE